GGDHGVHRRAGGEGEVPTVIVAIMATGAVAAAIGWRLVEARDASIWVVMGVVNAGAGLAALATGRVSLSPRMAPGGSVALGLGGGGAWGLLALWTGGVLASLLCHAVWTGLMVGLPPPGATQERRSAVA